MWGKVTMQRMTMAAVAVVLAATGCGGADDAVGTAPDAVPSAPVAVPTPTDATADVTITKCVPGDYGTFNPQLTIVNKTPNAASYTVTVSLNDPDGTRLGEASVMVNSVAPGETASVLAFGALSDPPAGVTCAVSSASRFRI